MEKKNKILMAITALAVASMMIAVPFMVSNNANATETSASVTSNVSFYVLDTTAGTQWTDATASGYDAYQALSSTAIPYTVSTNSVDPTKTNDSWYITIASPYGDYNVPNAEYGNLSSINGKSDVGVNEWMFFAYDGTNWNVITNNIGWIRPFADYQAASMNDLGQIEFHFASANIAIVYGSGSPESYIAMIVAHVTTPTSLTAIDKTSGSAYEMTFYLQGNNINITVAPNTVVKLPDGTSKTLTTDDIKNGITIVGYGSDAVSALYDAVGGSNIIFATEAPYRYDPVQMFDIYYSWVGSLFGVGDEQQGSDWYYWSSYVYDQDGTAQYCMYNLGYYSTLTGGYNYGEDFDMIYVS